MLTVMAGAIKIMTMVKTDSWKCLTKECSYKNINGVTSDDEIILMVESFFEQYKKKDVFCNKAA